VGIAHDLLDQHESGNRRYQQACVEDIETHEAGRGRSGKQPVQDDGDQ